MERREDAVQGRANMARSIDEDSATSSDIEPTVGGSEHPDNADDVIHAEKQAVVEHEWTIQSSLQVVGGFMLLFNSCAPHC